MKGARDVPPKNGEKPPPKKTTKEQDGQKWEIKKKPCQRKYRKSTLTKQTMKETRPLLKRRPKKFGPFNKTRRQDLKQRLTLS